MLRLFMQKLRLCHINKPFLLFNRGLRHIPELMIFLMTRFRMFMISGISGVMTSQAKSETSYIVELAMLCHFCNLLNLDLKLNQVEKFLNSPLSTFQSAIISMKDAMEAGQFLMDTLLKMAILSLSSVDHIKVQLKVIVVKITKNVNLLRK